MEISSCELYLFMRNIHYYEEGIYDIIKDLVIFKFKSYKELKDAVNIWCEDRERGLTLYCNISLWNVSIITDMPFLFINKRVFNDNINDWDVSNVTDMTELFGNCYEFNQPLDKWNVSKVEDMESTFYNCRVFNQDLSKWDVSKVIVMSNMFSGCKSFNYFLEKWLLILQNEEDRNDIIELMRYNMTSLN